MTHVAEIVTFTLADGVTPEEFVKLSQTSEAFVRAAPGFAHRQLSQGADGHWTDYVIWQDMKAAQDVAAQFPQQDFAPALIAAIQPDSVQIRHENVLWNMTA
ncbi:hypothetical protein [Ruegeria sp.]|uniref:hypothetical protein n=1 Tax=Ruegeria sp. TaxID=1879320 RepID=UPI003B5B26E8